MEYIKGGCSGRACGRVGDAVMTDGVLWVGCSLTLFDHVNGYTCTMGLFVCR